MSRVQRDFRLRITTAGANSVSGNVDLTIGTTSSADLPLGDPIPEVSAGMVRPLEGDVDPVSFHVRAIDETETLTNNLSDSGGRMDLLRRLVEWSFSSDGGASWSVLFTGRLRSIQQEDPTVYRLQVSNERSRETDITIFTEDDLSDGSWPFEATCTVVPEGVRPDLDRVHRFQVATPLPRWEILEDKGNSVYRLQAVDGDFQPHRVEVSDLAAQVIRDDVAGNAEWAGDDNFAHLQYREITSKSSKPYTGTDHNVVAFSGFGRSGTLGLGLTIDPASSLADDAQLAHSPLVKLSGTRNVGDVLEGFLYLPTKPPTERVPIHIGTQNGTLDPDPMWVIQQLYDFYNINYDSDAFTAWDPSTDPQAILDHPLIGGQWLRITETESLREFTRSIYAQFGMVPFTAAGEISPKRVLLPIKQELSDPSSAYTLRATKSGSNEANLDGSMPVWTHGTDRQVTRVQVDWTRINVLARDRFPEFTREAMPELGAEGPVAGLDMVVTEDRQDTYDHDRIGNFGTHTHAIELRTQHTPSSGGGTGETIATDLMDRYGDGPIEVEVGAIETAADSNGDTPADLSPGDWVLIEHEALPSPETGDRTGKRLMQVMDTRPTFGGYRIHLLDAGPNQQPSTGPGFTLAKDTSNSFRGVTATVSGLDSSADSWVLWLAESVSEPAAGASDWYIAGRFDASATTQDIGGLPSNTTIWGRAQAWENRRTRSGFSTADSATLDAYTAPTGLTVDSSLADAARISFTVGVAQLPTEVRLNRGNGLQREQVLDPGLTDAFLFNLDASTSYTVGVRHIDPDADPPGTSSETTKAFTTSGTADDPDDTTTTGNPGTPGTPSSPSVPMF